MPVSEAYNVDCMEYMSTLPDGFFDLAVVDPPYGINAPAMEMGSARGNVSTATRLRKGRLNAGAGKLKDRALQMMPVAWDFEPPKEDYFRELFRVSKNQIIWGGNYFHLPPTRGVVVWDKMQPWENFSQVELAWTSFDCPAKIVRIATTGGNNKEPKIHPTQKPVALYAWLFNKFAGGGIKYLIHTLAADPAELRPIGPGWTFTAARLTKIISSGCRNASTNSAGASSASMDKIRL